MNPSLFFKVLLYLGNMVLDDFVQEVYMVGDAEYPKLLLIEADLGDYYEVIPFKVREGFFPFDTEIIYMSPKEFGAYLDYFLDLPEGWDPLIRVL